MKSLILHDHEVRGILDGRQSQIRRPIKLPEHDPLADYRDLAPWCPLGQPGDKVWCGETFALHPTLVEAGHPAVFYRARGDEILRTNRWRSSATMPRWASRLTLEIVRVWVERVQDISEEDAVAEGIERLPSGLYRDYFSDMGLEFARTSFYCLWEYIYAKRGLGWDANPYVWCVEVKRVEA